MPRLADSKKRDSLNRSHATIRSQPVQWETHQTGAKGVSPALQTSTGRPAPGGDRGQGRFCARQTCDAPELRPRKAYTECNIEFAPKSTLANV